MIPALFAALILAQVPVQPIARTQPGWPTPAFKQAVIFHELGFHNQAVMLADLLWEQRDPETGLWVSQCCGVDTVNPLHAVVMYEKLGQHGRALETYRNHVARARAIPEMPYNGYWWPVVTARILDQQLPLDLLMKALPGFKTYMKNHDTDFLSLDQDDYYSDMMKGWWHWAGGNQLGFYEGATCYNRRQGRVSVECIHQYDWLYGRTWLPILSEPYGHWTDDTLYLFVLSPINAEAEATA